MYVGNTQLYLCTLLAVEISQVLYTAKYWSGQALPVLNKGRIYVT